MRKIRLHGFSFFAISSDSWLGRVWENFRQVFTPTKLLPTSANGAPIHVLKLDRSKRAERAQTLSLVSHVVIVVGLLAIASYPHLKKEMPHAAISLGGLLYSAPRDQFTSHPSLGRKAGGGENTATAATHGIFRAPIIGAACAATAVGQDKSPASRHGNDSGHAGSFRGIAREQSRPALDDYKHEFVGDCRSRLSAFLA